MNEQTRLNGTPGDTSPSNLTAYVVRIAGQTEPLRSYDQAHFGGKTAEWIKNALSVAGIVVGVAGTVASAVGLVT